MSKPKLVRIYPTGDHYIPGVPAIEQDVTPERAEELLTYHPPAFTTDPAPETPATEPPDGGPTEEV